jgi:hypothetical protein
MHPTFSPMCLSCESSNCADLYQARIHAGHRPRSGPQTCPPHAGLLRGGRRGGEGECRHPSLKNEGYLPLPTGLSSLSFPQASSLPPSRSPPLHPLPSAGGAPPAATLDPSSSPPATSPVTALRPASDHHPKTAHPGRSRTAQHRDSSARLAKQSQSPLWPGSAPCPQ